MIKNISYNDKKVRDEINSMVGDTYTWFDRIKMGGDGSPKFKVILASENIQGLLQKTNSGSFCNIELRPKGIIVGFSSIYETYVWVIPYYQLNIFKKVDYFSIYGGQEFLRIKNTPYNTINQTFIERMMEIRSSYLHQLALMN